MSTEARKKTSFYFSSIRGVKESVSRRERENSKQTRHGETRG